MGEGWGAKLGGGKGGQKQCQIQFLRVLKINPLLGFSQHGAVMGEVTGDVSILAGREKSRNLENLQWDSKGKNCCGITFF